MFARYFKQLNRVAFPIQHTRNVSFLKNLRKKEEPKPETNTTTESPFPQDTTNTQSNINFQQQESQAQTSQEMNIDPSILAEAEYLASRKRTNAIAEESAEMEFPEVPKSRGTELQEKIDFELDLPYKLYGSQIEITPRIGYMTDRVFVHHKIPKEFITNHLMKIYSGALYSIAARDEEFLGEYLEKYFSEKLLKSLTELQKKGYTIKVEKDISGKRGEPIEVKSEILDMIMVKGLNMDRDENKEESAYHKYVDIEDIGLVVYTPLEITDPANFIDPKKNQKMYDNHAKVIGRLLVEITSPLKLVIIRPNGEQIAVENEFNSFKHTAVFETQMKPPPKFTNINKMENYMEWLGKFKFGAWKMADLDNWMLGNPLILNQASRDKYKDDIFKGSKFDLESNIDLKKV